MLAIALYAQRKVHEAGRVITTAIQHAQPEAFIRPFLDLSVRSAPVLLLVLHTGRLGSEARLFIQGILNEVENTNSAPRPQSAGYVELLPATATVSLREQEVLRLVGSGLSNREIAAQISISVSTVKTHLENIYRKLGVNNRTQATAKARALHLV